MTKNEIKSTIGSVIDDTLPTLDPNSTLSQVDLTAITDAIASSMEDTVNPTGPTYPSTPR